MFTERDGCGEGEGGSGVGWGKEKGAQKVCKLTRIQGKHKVTHTHAGCMQVVVHLHAEDNGLYHREILILS